MNNGTPLILPRSLLPKPARTCADCRYVGYDGKQALCRRYPPQVSVLMTPAPPPRVGAMMPQPFATYPPIDITSPCGEYEFASGRKGEAA